MNRKQLQTQFEANCFMHEIKTNHPYFKGFETIITIGKEIYISMVVK